MSRPSFLYSAVNPSITSLNDALDQIGGGDARVATMELHCLIADQNEEMSRSVSASHGPHSGSVLWAGGSSVGIRNIDMPAHAPAAEAMRYFEVTSSSPLVRRDALFLNALPHDSVYRWLSDGFNASVITYGERKSFKTSMLFGAESDSPCMARSILSDLFDEAPGERLTIGMSCWCIRGNNVTDLLDPNKRSTKDSFLSVTCVDLEAALVALSLARERCPGSRVQDDYQPVSESQRAHFFCRVLVHRPDRVDAGRISCLHLIDLVGTTPVGDIAHGRLQEEDRISRRDTSIQLSTFAKVLHEMVEVSQETERLHDENSFSSQVRMTSARESTLTQVLAPILQGNSKTWVICMLMNGEAHYQHSMYTLRALDGIIKIKSACHRVQNVPVGALNLVSLRSVVPLPNMHSSNHYNHREQAVKQPQSKVRNIPTPNIPTPKHGVLDDRSEDEASDSVALDSYSQVDTDGTMEVPPSSPQTGQTSDPPRCFDSLMQEYQHFKSSIDDVIDNEGKMAPHQLQTRGEDKSNEPSFRPGPEMLTPYLHTMSRGSPMEELVKQEMQNDAALRQSQMNESRQRFEMQNFLMSQYTMQDDGRAATDLYKATATEAVERNIVRGHGLNMAELVAREFNVPYLESQGQYSQPQETEDAIRYSMAYRPQPQPHDEQLNQGRSDHNDRINDMQAHHVDSDSPEESIAETNSDDVPFTAALINRRNDDSSAISTNRMQTEAEHSHFDFENLVGDLRAASDYEALRKLNESLINAVRRENKIRIGLEEKLESVIASCEEEKGSMALHIADLKIEASKLRQVMRRMARDGPLDETLKYFEDEMRMLADENTKLRKRNLFLEDRIELVPQSLSGDNVTNCQDETNDSTLSASRHGGISSTPESRTTPAKTPLLNEASSRKAKKTVTSRDVAWNSMDGMSSSSGTENAEIRVLKAALRRARKDYDHVSNKMDAAKSMERRGEIMKKLHEECSKKLSFANTELERLQKEVDFERDLRFQRERDIGILNGELGVLQCSERELRNERSRTLSELAGARQRIRELEIERMKFASFDRFVQKHTASKWGDKQDSSGKIVKPGKKAPPSSAVWGSSNVPSSAAKENKGKVDSLNRRPATAAPSNMSALDTINDSNHHLVVSSFDTPGLASRMLLNTYDAATPQYQQHRARHQDTSTTKKTPPPLPVYTQPNSKGILKLSGHKSSLMDMSASDMENSIARGVVGVAGLSNAQVYCALD